MRWLDDGGGDWMRGFGWSLWDGMDGLMYTLVALDWEGCISCK